MGATHSKKKSQSLAVTGKKAHFNLSDFDFQEFLGQGGYSLVAQATHLPTKQRYAIKMIDRNRVRTQKQAHRLFLERDILSEISHPFIVKLHGNFKDENQLYFVMEYVDGKDLAYHLSRNKRLTNDVARIIAAALAVALAYLHDSGIVYRDLKTKNIMIGSDRSIKLVDFGLSRKLGPLDVAYSFVGTPHCMAPEMIDKTGHGYGIDWWCFGVLLYEMLVGRPPFYDENRNKLFEKIRRGKLRFPDFVEPAAVDLITRLLVKEPQQRIGVVRGGRSSPLAPLDKWRSAHPEASPLRASYNGPIGSVARLGEDDAQKPPSSPRFGRRVSRSKQNGSGSRGYQSGSVSGSDGSDRAWSPDSDGPGASGGTGTCSHSRTYSDSGEGPAGDSTQCTCWAPIAGVPPPSKGLALSRSRRPTDRNNPLRQSDSTLGRTIAESLHLRQSDPNMASVLRSANVSKSVNGPVWKKPAAAPVARHTYGDDVRHDTLVLHADHHTPQPHSGSGAQGAHGHVRSTREREREFDVAPPFVPKGLFQHPWFRGFDWTALMEGRLRPTIETVFPETPDFRDSFENVRTAPTKLNPSSAEDPFADF